MNGFIKYLEKYFTKFSLTIAFLVFVGLLIFLFINFFQTTQEINFYSELIEQESVSIQYSVSAEPVLSRHEKKISGTDLSLSNIKDLFGPEI